MSEASLMEKIATVRNNALLASIQELTPKQAREAAIAEAMKDWKATGTIVGVPVMKVPGPVNRIGRKQFPIFLNEHGRHVPHCKGRIYIAYDADDMLAPPVDEFADTPAGASYPPPGYTRRTFRTQDIAAAVMACMGAHQGVPWIFGPDNSEGELLGRNADGTYEVVCRVYDWKEKCHHRFRLRIPERIDFDVALEG